MRQGSGSAGSLRLAQLGGNGQFGFAVVGESHHQFELEEIVGFRTAESADFECAALLVPEPDNAFDRNAIVVMIGGAKVGYLPRKVAAHYSLARQLHGVDVALCDAMIVGGWDRGENDLGHFGVKLDVSQPFRFENIRDWQPDESQPVATTPNGTSRTMIAGMSEAEQAAVQGPSPQRSGRNRYVAMAIAFIFAGVAVWYVIAPPREGRIPAAATISASPAISAHIWQAAEVAAVPRSTIDPAATVDRPYVPLPRPRPAAGPLRLLHSP